MFKLAYPTQAKRYPIVCLFIKVPQNEVDVNLEPGKYDVLLHNLVWLVCKNFCTSSVYIFIVSIDRMKS